MIWRWVNCDLTNVKWRDPTRESIGFGFAKKGYGGLHPLIFKRLLQEDPHYVRYFLQAITEVMNHRVSLEFINERIKYYDNLVLAFEIEIINCLQAHCFLKGDHKRFSKRLTPIFKPSRL